MCLHTLELLNINMCYVCAYIGVFVYIYWCVCDMFVMCVFVCFNVCVCLYLQMGDVEKVLEVCLEGYTC